MMQILVDFEPLRDLTKFLKYFLPKVLFFCKLFWQVDFILQLLSLYYCCCCLIFYFLDQKLSFCNYFSLVLPFQRWESLGFFLVQGLLSPGLPPALPHTRCSPEFAPWLPVGQQSVRAGSTSDSSQEKCLHTKLLRSKKLICFHSFSQIHANQYSKGLRPVQLSKAQMSQPINMLTDPPLTRRVTLSLSLPISGPQFPQQVGMH